MDPGHSTRLRVTHWCDLVHPCPSLRLNFLERMYSVRAAQVVQRSWRKFVPQLRQMHAAAAVHVQRVGRGFLGRRAVAMQGRVHVVANLVDDELVDAAAADRLHVLVRHVETSIEEQARCVRELGDEITDLSGLVGRISIEVTDIKHRMDFRMQAVQVSVVVAASVLLWKYAPLLLCKFVLPGERGRSRRLGG